MAEYIEREAALRAFGDEPLNWNDTDAELQEVTDWKNYRNAIMAIPAADVRPVKHGHWTWTETGDEDYEQFWVCSVCGEHDFYEANYCPNCGARMVEDAK